ncbi:MAG TPA: hypothetical protein P5018_01755 [Rectinema sp.]|jgi:hypothetical protein|nr:hypothetical protein [Spirochaetota bacterium]NLH89526.1 hypothetical protein [Treponema sp.]HNT58819.1 hypothetical protein [Rectinema sp.]HNZ93051.1 hypothetical protein [Rectinema sp.]HOI99792.1 hypothetical protein [Rectinema sp.]
MNRRCLLLLIVFLCGDLLVYCFPAQAQEENPGSEIVAKEEENSQEAPEAPVAPEAPAAPEAPVAPEAQEAPAALEAPKVTLPTFSYSDTKEGMFRRSLVISIGLFPFSYFYTNFAFDLARYISHGFDTAYAPWPFNTQYGVALTNSEVWTRIGIASGASILLGFLSVIIE